MISIIPFNLLFKALRVVKITKITKLARLSKVTKTTKILKATVLVAKFKVKADKFLKTNNFNFLNIIIYQNKKQGSRLVMPKLEACHNIYSFIYIFIYLLH